MSESLKIIASSVAKLRALLSETRKDLERIRTLQSALTQVLDGFWESVDATVIEPALWRETLSLVASGRVLSVAAQAEEALKAASNNSEEYAGTWISSGSEYSRWLGQGISKLAEIEEASAASPEKLKAAAQLCGKSLNLGYNDSLVEQVIYDLALQHTSTTPRLQGLVALLSTAERRRFLISTINLIQKRYLSNARPDFLDHTTTLNKAISASAALLRCVVSSADTLEEDICGWATSQPLSNSMARAILAALPSQAIKTILRTSWEQFGDKLRTKHTPALQQESTAQVLLMAAGYIQRFDPTDILMRARSTTHANAISSRLGSSSPRVRFLGMIIGMAISQLVDKPENRMKFEDQEVENAEAKWYLRLTTVHDSVGSLTDLQPVRQEKKPVTAVIKRKPAKSKANTAPKPLIAEIIDVDDEDDDLAVYSKPDSDPEDEDEDPTLIQRNKPKAPVYIRDLIANLRDTENYDAHHLALTSAALLIRRKAGFGAEVKDRADELASVLIGLGDPFAIEDWHELRQDAMVASVMAVPRQMAELYVRAFFVGDYSIGQRASVLVALGLAARELAGLKKEDEIQATFATKKLPERLHKYYAETAEVDALARKLEQTMLRPVATKQKRKVVRNQLSGIVAESFFFPLTGYWQSLSTSPQSRKTLHNPHLLPLFLKTLAIILSATGPTTLLLPQITTEYWSLLLSLRSAALADPALMEAHLFSLLTILNVNEDRHRQLVVDCSNEIIETREWVGMVYERLGEGAGEGEDEERCKVLAAGVLVKVKEVVEKYQRLMVGSMVMM